MIRRLLSVLGVLAVAAALVAAPTLALAQAAAGVAAPAPIDWKDAAAKAILGLSTVVTYLAVSLLKRAWEKVPAASVFIVAPVLGIGIDFAITYLTGHPSADPVLAAVFGLLSIVLHEAKTTVQDKGVSGPFTVRL